MKTTCNDIRLSFNEKLMPEFTLTPNSSKQETLEGLAKLREILGKGKMLSVEIKRYHPDRSKDANSYCWALCQKIAESIGNTKDFVYQTAIKRVGQFEIIPIKKEAVERWIEVWNGKGLGWFSEVLEDSKLPGYKKVISYYGSSVYNSREMAVLIDEIISECKELGIDTVTESEKNLLLREWGKC